ERNGNMSTARWLEGKWSSYAVDDNLKSYEFKFEFRADGTYHYSLVGNCFAEYDGRVIVQAGTGGEGYPITPYDVRSQKYIIELRPQRVLREPTAVCKYALESRALMDNNQHTFKAVYWQKGNQEQIDLVVDGRRPLGSSWNLLRAPGK